MIEPRQVKEGVRVRLLPFEENPEERGTMMSNRVDNGTVIIDLDKEFRDDDFDTGIREVPLEQLEILHEK